MLNYHDLAKYRGMLQKARTSHDAVVMEQMRAITENLPQLYAMLSVAVAALGLSFLGKAPLYLTAGVPVVFVAVSLFRIYRWRNADKELSSPRLLKKGLSFLHRVTLLVFVGLGGWVWSLLPYANETERLMLAFFVAFTGAAATICGMSHPRIVASTLSLTFLQFCVLFLGHGERFYPFMAVQLAVSYLVFYHFSASYKKRIVQTVVLHNELMSENERSSGLAESNRSLALSDTLTGLPNRRRFFEEIALYFTRCPEGKLPVVGLVDLDGFKPINDVFGHAAGDVVLVETARRLQEVVGDAGAVARLGGDEFAYVLPWDTPQAVAVRIAYDIVATVEKPFRLPNGDAARVSTSIGFSSRKFAVESAQELLEQADFALFRAKEVQLGCAVEFSASHAATKRRETLVQQAFRNADLEKEIHLVFQPIVNSTDGSISRCEALARWDSPEIGIVSPNEFVPVAERAGMTQEMTRIILRKTIAQLKVWPDTVRVSVNLSAQDVNSRHTTDVLAGMLIRESQKLRECICIEVTESSLLTDFEEVRLNLLKFRDLGLNIALDDFGTGYSSLRYIQELEFDIVKIDRSFIASVEENSKSFGLIRVIQQLCRSLSIACVVEGVETPEQLDKARLAGCHFVQGYLYSEPLLPREIAPYLTGEKRFPDYRALIRDDLREAG